MNPSLSNGLIWINFTVSVRGWSEKISSQGLLAVYPKEENCKCKIHVQSCKAFFCVQICVALTLTPRLCQLAASTILGHFDKSSIHPSSPSSVHLADSLTVQFPTVSHQFLHPFLICVFLDWLSQPLFLPVEHSTVSYFVLNDRHFDLIPVKTMGNCWALY